MSFISSYYPTLLSDLAEAGFRHVPTTHRIDLDHVALAGALGVEVAVIMPLISDFADRLFEILKNRNFNSVPFCGGAIFKRLEKQIEFPGGGRIYFVKRDSLNELRGRDLKAIFLA